MKKEISTNLAWAALLLGSGVEWIWVSGLKYADSFALHALTALAISFSFCAMLVAIKKIEVSIAYSVFVGLGTAGVVVSEILIFNEPFNALKVTLISTLLLGVIGLKFVSKEKNEQEIALNLSHEFGLDELGNSQENSKENSKDKQ